MSQNADRQRCTTVCDRETLTSDCSSYGSVIMIEVIHRRTPSPCGREGGYKTGQQCGHAGGLTSWTQDCYRYFSAYPLLLLAFLFPLFLLFGSVR